VLGVAALRRSISIALIVDLRASGTGGLSSRQPRLLP
jgi:hypothetical protein